MSHLQTLPIAIGATLQNGYAFLTGTQNDGTMAGTDCKGWTSGLTTDTSVEGIAYYISGWSDNDDQPCNHGFRQLYCFSDLDRIFDSGVEGIPY